MQELSGDISLVPSLPSRAKNVATALENYLKNQLIIGCRVVGLDVTQKLQR